MGSVQLLMTLPASLPSPSTGRPIQRRFQSHHQAHSQQQLPQLSGVQTNHGQHPTAFDSRTAATANVAASITSLAAQVPAQSQHWQASGLPTVGGTSTFQPYAMAPPVTAPACGQLKVVHLSQEVESSRHA